MKYSSFLFLFVFLFASMTISAQQWRSLTNGKDLSNWERLNGEAKYSFADGVIIGEAVLNTPNTFLATKEKFSDFILELQFKVDPQMNSGVQVRSESLADYKNYRVHGYQVEFDPSERAWTGGIYDEARRGWLYTMDENPKGKKAFKQNEWNKLRIEAKGNNIRTWVNGVPTANILDNLTSTGFIALQVHDIKGDKAKEGIKAMWKDVRIMTENIDKYLTSDKKEIPQYNYIPNTLTDREKTNGWKLLWDGKTTEGWRSAKADKFPSKGWEIDNGVIKVLKSTGAEATNGGDIITAKKYKDFELKFEFLITEGANSGVKYFVDPDMNQGEGSAIGCEYQILDDEKHPDAKLGVNGNRTVASLYDLIPAVAKRFNGVGMWNNGKIIVKGNHVEHWLNGFKTVEYERNNQMWRALVAYSKYKNWPNFGDISEGYILLQDHGDEVWFKSIKIHEL